MKTTIPEQRRQWLIAQTESCLRQAGMKIDSLVATSLEKSSNEYMAVLERLTASKKTEAGNPTE